MCDEKEKIESLKPLLGDSLQPDRHDEYYLWRFLSVNGWDVNLAAQQLKDDVAWRAEAQVEEMVAKYGAEGNDVRTRIQQYVPLDYHGVDRQGCPVYVERHGQVDVAGMMAAWTGDQILNHHVYLLEKGEQLKKAAGTAKHLVIEDCSGLGWALLNTEFLSVAKNILTLDEQRYPELTRKMYVVNAPWIFNTVFGMIKPWLSQSTIDKVEVLGSDFITVLEKEVALDQLPKELGGKCTQCGTGATCLGPGGTIPTDLYRSGATASGGSGPGKTQEVSVGAGSQHQVRLTIKKPNTVVGYEFATKKNDIGFGIDFLGVDGKSTKKSIVESKKFESHKTRIHDTLQCDEAGVYLFTFDNSFSMFTSKALTFSIFKAEVEN